MASSAETLDALNEVHGREKPEDVGLGEWIWGALQGDFNGERSIGQIGFDMVVSMIPVIDTICDLRDLVANVKQYHKHPTNKITLFFIATTVVGFFPEIGTIVKSTLRVVWVYLKPVVKHADDLFNVSKLVSAAHRACDAALPKITEYLQHSRVVQWATHGKIPDMYRFMSKSLGEAMEKLNPAMLGKFLSEKFDDLLGLLKKIRLIVPSTVRDHIDDFIQLINKHRHGLINAVQEFIQPVRTVLKMVAKRLEDHAWHVETYRTNRGWIAPISETGSAKLINGKPPKWAKKLPKKMKFPPLMMKDPEMAALTKANPHHPPLAKWFTQTFSEVEKIRADVIKCLDSWDHVPIRSWPLFKARHVLRTLFCNDHHPFVS